jgi:hypothetical protein
MDAQTPGRKTRDSNCINTEGTTCQATSVLEIVRELRMTHPSIGVKKLVNAAKKATKYTHPDWKVGSKDVRAALSSLETEKATMTKAPKEDLIIYQSSLPDSEGEEEYDPMKEVINHKNLCRYFAKAHKDADIFMAEAEHAFMCKHKATKDRSRCGGTSSPAVGTFPKEVYAAQVLGRKTQDRNTHACSATMLPTTTTPQAEDVCKSTSSANSAAITSR